MISIRGCALAVVVVALVSAAVPASVCAQSLPPPPPPPVPSATATPFPSLSPPPGTQSPSPFPTPSGGPSPPPSTSPLPGLPIRVDRSRVGVVPGTTIVVNVSGGVGPLVAQASFDGVDVRYDDLTRRLSLTGRTNGRGTVTLSDAAGDTAVVNVLVAPPAGVVPNDALVELAGTVSPQFARDRVQAAVAQLAQMQPGTTLSVGGVNTAALRPGDALEARANVAIRGNDNYVDQIGTTNVHLRVDSLPPLDPLVLFYSDDPERLGPLDDGVLLRGTIDATRPARAYVYHVSDAGSRRLYIALQAAGGTSRVQVLGASAGPNDAFSYVGHLSTKRYLLERAPQESFVATVAPGLPYFIPLGAGPLLPGQLLASIDDLRVLDGGPVNVMVVAAGTGVDPSTLLGQPEHPSDGHFRRGEFSLANVPPLALAYTVGGPEPQPFAAGVRYYANGQAAFPNLRPDLNAQAGQRAPLAGDYGVLRSVSLQIANPTSAPQNVYLYEQPGANGGVTTNIWFTGDPAPTEVLCVSDPSQRYLVKGFGLAPGQTLTVTGSYMTDGTSFLPVYFGLTPTLPPAAPPNGCGPKPGYPPPSI
ncbi:MAG: hypothetical protein JO036_16510 [Candidatus Eremiobacteraeota bacterium]|nr:hypothetical protein [Candidatus Eremiobacteraeota bacterium]